jgi:hypothetical protein
MSAAQHTPGPWVAHGTIVYFPNNRGGFNIANCPDSESNARLIAAAPELLEALVDAANFIQAYSVGQVLLERIDAAIAKATGGAA